MSHVLWSMSNKYYDKPKVVGHLGNSKIYTLLVEDVNEPVTSEKGINNPFKDIKSTLSYNDKETKMDNEIKERSQA